MKYIQVILCVSFMAGLNQPAVAQQASPPEARPFTTQEQKKSLSDMMGAPDAAKPAPLVQTKPSTQNPIVPSSKTQPQAPVQDVMPVVKQKSPEARPFSSMESMSGKTLSDLTKKDEPPKKDGVEKRNQPHVEIWLPPDFQASKGPWPLLIFSHAFGGCAKQAAFLTTYLADHGYIVIAPDHADARCNKYSWGNEGLQSFRGGTKDWPEQSFRKPDAWTDKTENDRKEDVLFALSSMLDDRQYAPFIDQSKMGLIGHSLGGYTMLGIAGAWPSWKDKRFRAVEALSPYADPYLSKGRLGRLDIPVLYEGGIRDSDIVPLEGNPAYFQTSSPKYYIELDGAGHLGWTELSRNYQEIIQKSSLAFFDKYLKGQDQAILSEGRVKGVKTFWKDEGKAIKK